MKITAVKGKAAVFVVNWGRAPFAIETTKRGVAYIPDGFIVEAKSDSHFWIAETRVTSKGNAEYRFSLRDDPTIRSEWRLNPTAAYKDVNTKYGNLKFATGSNGRLIIGVTYENLQAEIIKRFATEISKVQGTLPTSPSATENIRPFPAELLRANTTVQPSGQVRKAEALELGGSHFNKKARFDDVTVTSSDLEVEKILLSLRHGFCAATWSAPTLTMSQHRLCENVQGVISG